MRRLGGVSWGPLLRLSQGVTKHICTDLFTGQHAKQAAALTTKKKGNGADWFPGPDMPVNVGSSWCTELRWLPSLLGQQDTGPIPAPALASVLIPWHHPGAKTQGFHNQRGPNQSRDVSHHPQPWCPKPPTPVNERRGLQGGREEEAACLAFPRFC